MATLSEIAKKVVEIGGLNIIDPLRSVLGKYKTLDENGVFISLEATDLCSKLFRVEFLTSETLFNSSSIPSILNNIHGYNANKQQLQITFDTAIIREFLTSIGVENVTSTLINEFKNLLKYNILVKIYNNVQYNRETREPMVNIPKLFEEYSFDYGTPFSLKEQQAYNFGLADYYDINSNYNFYEKSFEQAIENVDERIIPNLYLSQQETGSFGEQHTRLKYTDGSAGAGYYVSSNTVDNGFYFDSWADNVSSILAGSSINDYQKLFIPATYLGINKNFSFIADTDNNREDFPIYNKIEFTTDSGELGINTILNESDINCSFINTSLKEGLGTIFTLGRGTLGGEIVGNYSIVKNSSISFDENNNPIIQYSYQNNRFIGLELDFQNILSSSIFTGQPPSTGSIPLISYLDPCDDSNTDIFSKNLTYILSKLKINNIANSNYRIYKQIFDGELAQNETLIYIVKKITTSNQVQGFIFLNPLEARNFVYYDTQVKYGQKYKYEVDAYQVVVGTNYTFDNFQDKSNGFEIDCISIPSLKLVQTKYCEKEIVNADSPPIPLDIMFVPYFGINNKISIYMNSQVGRQHTEPVIILDQDQQSFDNNREAQGIETGPILFESEDPASLFQIMRLENKPTSYQDFKDSLITNIYVLENSFSNTYLDILEPNKTYYYIFRTKDVHSNVSNPTPVYQLTLRDDGGAVYPEIEVLYNFDIEVEKDAFKAARKYIHLSPSITQTSIEIGEEAESANNLEQLKLGYANDPVWGKQFKVRVRSKSTGKLVDFNVTFTNKEIRE
jgi:hypothetical protein